MVSLLPVKYDFDLLANKLTPLFEDEISIVLSADNNYTPYVAVTIKSLIENSKNKNNYVAYILEDNFSEENQRKISSLEKENFKIRFLDIIPYIESKIDKSIFHVSDHFTPATYYRFFIPEIFQKFNKILYVDCDLIFVDDIEELINTDLNGKLIGAAKHLNVYYSFESEHNYTKEILGLKDSFSYFNAGVMLFDIKAALKNNFRERAINKLKEIKKPKYVDQCILNSAFQDDVYFINTKWNFNYLRTPYEMLDEEKQRKYSVPKEVIEEYKDALKDTKVIHYAGGGACKPWVTNSTTCLSEYFWKYAKLTPFYEEILYKNIMSDVKEIYFPQSNTPLKYNNFFEKIFSVKNAEGRKILTIFCLKLKFRR